MSNPKRRAQSLCNAKNAISKAIFELHNAEMEGASIDPIWFAYLTAIRDKITWEKP